MNKVDFNDRYGGGEIQFDDEAAASFVLSRA
jgi:hypothetical protein